MADSIQAAVSAALERMLEDIRARGVVVVGISGKMGHGKDTVATMLKADLAKLGYAGSATCITSFARALKCATTEIFGLSIEQLYGQQEKEVVDGRWGLSPRTILQTFGTEAMRSTFGPNLWPAALFANVPPATKVVIITDVRFPNEADLIKRLDGVLVRVVRPTVESGSTHSSETALDDYPFLPHEYLHNAGTLSDLIWTVNENVAPRVTELLRSLE